MAWRKETSMASGVAALAVASVMLTGCGAAASGNCAPVGIVPGVYVKYDVVVSAHPGDRLHGRACLDTTCRSFPIGTSGRRADGNAVMLGTNTVRDATPHTVSLTISNDRRRVVYSGRTTATPQRTGSACNGYAFETYVTASGAHTLTPAP